ncbi:MAG TPA: DegT/DnrJ/EryC1/StrS family aminotransferase [Bacteroidales bacterium]|nr:DegT/DnrJ/EryC1/StrS family aminotransferase [Bacteroidales bacterium]
MIPFSPPYISEDAIRAVEEVLRSGWITTGPVTKKFEQQLTEYCGNKKTLCLNSATAGLELILRWYGVGAGDEVIIPAYTYCATANVVAHCGAIPVMVDTNSNDFNISVDGIRRAITERTKVIVPVDVFGIPCDYNEINTLVRDSSIRKMFRHKNEVQRMLGRILVMSDAAHSVGAIYCGKKTGSLTDVSVFSFHAVKNLTTSEGGAIALNLPEPFDCDAIYKQLNISSLHGQSKDALAKTTKKGWRYDVLEAGYKMNMTDILAAIGVSQLKEYEQIMLKRRQIFKRYSDTLKPYDWAVIPEHESENKKASFHVYNLKIKDADEAQRDRIIDIMFEKEVFVNVHFQPLPLLTYYKKEGYKMSDFPNAFKHYSCEISLPVFYNMTEEQVSEVIETLIFAVEKTRVDG